MSQDTHIDGVLLVWGERWDWSPKNRKPRGVNRTGTGLPVPSKANQRRPMTVAAARANLKAFTRKSPQVIVKISGGGRGLRKVMNHLSYIARNGENPLEDEHSEAIEGKEGLKDLRLAWGQGGYPIPDESDKRESINIVLSMPEGTDELAVLRAARAFAKAEFSDNHQYALALHTFTTDPGPKPSRHPHAHLAVKVRGRNGIRLNPRKADLQDWRESFAQALREHGVDATATRRRTRLQRSKGEKQAIRHIKGRGVEPRVQSTAAQQPRAAARAKENVAQVMHDYKTIAYALADSDQDDRKLALDLVQTLRELNARHQHDKERQKPREEPGQER